jgi:pyruvate dehydrogenase E2 component (dihydrolipoamide acetyltransferase)
MARAWSTIPHVTHQDLVDVTKTEAFRQRHKVDIAGEGGHLTLTTIAIKAVAAALKQHPRFNASLDDESEEIVLKHHCNIGVAVDSDDGLLVPVIRNVHEKSLTELATELDDLIERVKKGEAKPEDLRDGTFTITNVGPLGGRFFTPIVNHPEVAILGMGQANLEPHLEGTTENHSLHVQLRLPLSLAFDHRVNDGADAARFIATVKEGLSDPETLALTS